MASNPPPFDPDAYGAPVPPGAGQTPEQRHVGEAVIKLIGFLGQHLRGGFLYGALDDGETETSRHWNAWELTGYNHGNLGVAVALPDVLSMYVNQQFRMSPEDREEDARRAREYQGYFCGFVQQPRGMPPAMEWSRPPKHLKELMRTLHAANSNLAEWLSAYLLVGHVLTEDDQIASIIKTNMPPGMSPQGYWQSALVVVDYAQSVYLTAGGFQPMYSITARVAAELQDIVQLRPPTLQQLMGDGPSL